MRKPAARRSPTGNSFFIFYLARSSVYFSFLSSSVFQQRPTWPLTFENDDKGGRQRERAIEGEKRKKERGSRRGDSFRKVATNARGWHAHPELPSQVPRAGTKDSVEGKEEEVKKEENPRRERSIGGECKHAKEGTKVANKRESRGGERSQQRGAPKTPGTQTGK